MSVKDNLQKIKNTIIDIKQKNNINTDICLVAVSKTKPVELIKKAIEAGHLHFGENRVNEAIKKIEEISNDKITWHLIGHLQSNKASKAARYFDVIHSVDSIKIAKEINHYANLYKRKIQILIQVNTSEEESKYGCSIDDTTKIADYIIKECPNLVLKGLMTIGPLTDNEELVRLSFKKLSTLKTELSTKYGNDKMDYLSMGMSGDYQIAIEEGSTHLRIGSAIFGIR